jgi:hypothetical protein
LQPLPRLTPKVLETRLEEWRRLLRGSTTQGRAVLQRVLRGRIVFTPITDEPLYIGYEFQAPTRFDRLFLGVSLTARPGAPLEPVPDWMPNDDGRGGEELRRFEERREVDYGLLLERVTENGKWLASPRGPGRFYTLRGVGPCRAA